MKTDADMMRRALDLARQALAAGEFPVGCVVADAGVVLADGARRGSREALPSEIEHAEIIALRRLERLGPDRPRSAMTLYTTLEPCLMCYGAIMLAGIGRVVYAYEDAMGGALDCPLEHLKALYHQRGPQVDGPLLRPESLALFKRFFDAPDVTYWRGSLLADYTLKQP